MSRAPEVRLAASAASASLGELPPGGSSNEASALATRWVLRLTALLLFALAVLCTVGPHIPSGE